MKFNCWEWTQTSNTSDHWHSAAHCEWWKLKVPDDKMTKLLSSSQAVLTMNFLWSKETKSETVRNLNIAGLLSILQFDLTRINIFAFQSCVNHLHTKESIKEVTKQTKPKKLLPLQVKLKPSTLCFKPTKPTANVFKSLIKGSSSGLMCICACHHVNCLLKLKFFQHFAMMNEKSNHQMTPHTLELCWTIDFWPKQNAFLKFNLGETSEVCTVEGFSGSALCVFSKCHAYPCVNWIVSLKLNWQQWTKNQSQH